MGKSKSDAGESRVVPLNSDFYGALVEHHAWYQQRFGAVHDEWYLFPFGNPRPSDSTPACHLIEDRLEEERAQEPKVKGRWHDNRHTLITELAESGAGDETIMEIASHVDRQMLRNYSHIHMKAKRAALGSQSSRDRRQQDWSKHVFGEAALRAFGNPGEGTQV